MQSHQQQNQGLQSILRLRVVMLFPCFTQNSWISSQVPYTFQHFAQAEPPHSCIVACEKFTNLATTSTTWFIFNTNLHHTSWCIVKCKNVHFCSGFISVTLSSILFKSPTFFLIRFGKPSVVTLASLSQVSSNFLNHAWTNHSQFLPLSLIAWQLVPPWFSSL